ncbi:PstS family phosphate ABC transporter substrate-binding protein [Paenibacillus sp. MMS18-CY102]|uniref:PstS family phosphate ABC transporter substrate-binding protein n=1 Tax=Paenibacillus sp. MMS18-CY102 TaxID=2682849 RepID=UPI001365FE46|nr:PstS family phosphate ABC transporter substrate-binding protein [Paenibacillus sp. MMS18-CY102]MWC28551.1 phosphate ABC transporter substrate-binding protein PstS family protein [Paenibacillus sp. MMS18-CY102]
MLKGKGRKGIVLVMMMALLMMLVAACGDKEETKGSTEPANTEQTATDEKSGDEETAAVGLKGEVEIDGSSTVYPLTEAAAEEFGKDNPDVRVTVGVSGTGGGFKRFCNGETAISDASRPIKGEEADACKAKGIEYTDLQVAYDGLSIVVSKDNDFIDHLTVEELNKIFVTGSTVKTWADVRAGWPAEEIKMYSPGADSGTYDYFNEEILEKKGIRNDTQISFSEDDNTLVQGVEGSKYSIGYFGFAYYEENADKLKLVPVDAGKGAISPTVETIKDGTYAPLSRPLFIYVNKRELERPEVNAFVDYYINNIGEMAKEVGYVPLPDEKYDAEAAKLQ